jgi:hypothetical protein
MRDLKPTPLNILWWHHVCQSVGWMARKMGDKLLLFRLDGEAFLFFVFCFFITVNVQISLEVS